MLQKDIPEGSRLYLTNLRDYLSLFEIDFPQRNVFSKDYGTTLFRSLIIYFVYKENEFKIKPKISLKMLGDYFGFKDHTAALKSIRKIEAILEDDMLLLNYPEEGIKQKFCNFYYKLNKLFHAKEQTMGSDEEENRKEH